VAGYKVFVVLGGEYNGAVQGGDRMHIVLLEVVDGGEQVQDSSGLMQRKLNFILS